jgi:hypothetical protein
MKKTVLMALILFLFKGGFVMAQQVRVLVALPLSGPTYLVKWSQKVIDLTGRYPPSGRIIVTYADSGDYLKYGSLAKLVSQENPQIFIGPIFPLEFKDAADLFKGYQQYRDRLFIIPFLNRALEESKIVGLTNAFILPQPITNTLAAIDRSIDRYGVNLELLKKSLKEEETIIQNRYLGWEKVIDKMVKTGMSDWERKTMGRISSPAAALVEESYTGNTISYLKSYAVLNIDITAIEKRTPAEVQEIFDTYYAKTGRKEVSLMDFKNSGVNDCEHLPCKTHCCPQYIQWNHECLNRIDCPKQN